MRWSDILRTAALQAVVAISFFAGISAAKGIEAARTGMAGEVIATRQTVFTIPFVTATVTPGDTSQLEVQLYVSTDQGQTWTHYQTAQPSEQRFSFRAARDGEYWFTTRTVPRGTPTAPVSEAAPELKVAVDTAQPKLNLTADIGAADEVRVSWQIEDDLLAADSFTLSYQTGDNNWRSIAIDRARQQQTERMLSGSAAFWPQPASETIELRAEIRDRAGNVAIANRRLRMPPTMGLAARPRAPQQPTPAASDLAGGPAPAVAGANNGGTPWPVQDVGSPRPAPAGSGQTVAETHSRPTATGSGTTTADSGQLGWRTPDRGQSAASAPPSTGGTPYAAPQPTYTQPTATAPVPTGPQAEPPAGPIQLSPQGPSYSPDDRTAQLPYHDPFQGMVGEVHRPVSDRVDLSPATPPVTAPAGSLVTSARHFNLDYDVEGIDPAALARIELWGSGDGGRTWTKWGQDDDNTSPLPVEVQREGVYGFRVVIVTANGLASRPPQPGDAPEVMLTVDWTVPQAEFTTAQYGTAEQLGRLIITWRASDENLAEKPIRLLVSDQVGGPWQAIAEDLPNNGLYAWQVTPSAPRQAYLRLEVRDRAGNLGWYELQQPIALDGLMPRARIRAVQPVEAGP